MVQKHTSKIIASIISVLVITLLIFAGPAQAFEVSLDAFDSATPTQGQIISTTATINIDSNERVNINYVNMTVNGADYCMFNAYTGANLSECAGVSVQVVSSATLGYGYGYGYGYAYGYGYQNGYSNGQFTYNITLNTSAFSLGSKSIQLFVDLGGHVYPSASQSFNVTAVDQVALAFDSISTTLDSSNVTNNLNEVTSSNVEAFSGLYFEKENVGKITFTNALNLSDSATQTYLQNLDSYLNISDGHISLNTKFAAFLSGAGAIVSMNNFPGGLALNNITLTVTDDDGNVLNMADIVSNMSYTSVGACQVGVSQCSIFSFSTLHFTSFDASIGPAPTTSSSSGGTGAYNPNWNKTAVANVTNVTPAENQTQSANTTSTNQNANGGSLLTGAFIGTTAGKLSVTVIIFLIAVVLAWWIISRRKKAALPEKKATITRKKKK